ncbi:MAG: S-layer homology domain-containing protein [Bifidobacteriaceae bacterium]|jgi:hypothetical protein|nr:S-layer homology domain-containing protein [Bifidobacteriaceae bacterium]
MNSLKTNIVNRYKNFVYFKSLFKKAIFCLVVAFVFQTIGVGFQTPLVQASMNDAPPAPENVVIERISNYSLGVSWSPPSPEPLGDWTYKVDLVDEIDRVVQTAQNISKSVLTQTFANLFTSNYKVKVYVQISGGQISSPAESDKSRPVQIALGAAATNINFKDISSLEAESQAKIKWAAAFGITTGYTSTTYNPKKAVNRRQMASFFKRLAGGPAPSGQPIKFKDVTDKEQNKADIDWLSAAGITTGYVCTAKGKPDKACTKAGDAVYMPNSVVNRGQMAQFIYKYVGQPYISPDEVNSYMEEFSDSQKLRDNGQAEAVAWLLKYNITQGYPDSTYRPTTRVSREQMAVFLARLANILNITPYLARESIETNGNLVLPTNFLGISNLNRKNITKISFIETLPVCNNPVDVSSSKNGSILGCVKNNTEIVIGEPLGVKGNPYSADGLFSNLSTSALQSLDFSVISNLGNVFSSYAAFAVDQGFVNSVIPSNFVFPKGFGVNSENMAYMFANRIFAHDRIFEEDFAKNVINMNAMFSGATLNGDIDWSETNFLTSTASKTDMFTGVIWNDYFILVQNEASRIFLVTNSNIGDPSRIRVKGGESILKMESINPVTFLGISGPARSQITKISFQKTKPTCSNPTDVSSDGDKSILGCVENDTEIIIGSDGGVEANPISSWLFSNLSLSPNGASIDLSNLRTSDITDMSYMFTNTRLIRGLSLPQGFGSVVTNMLDMFYDSALPSGFSLPVGFGSMATNMKFMFGQVSLPSGFSFPSGFGSVATDMDGMFQNAILPSGFLLPAGFGSLATSMNRTFQQTKLNSDFSLPAGFGAVATNMNYMFMFTLLPSGFSLPAGFGSVVTNMQGMFYMSTLPSGFSFPAGFGSKVVNMSHIFEQTSLPNNFSLPTGFGAVALDISYMFHDTTLRSGFSLPVGFGAVALDVSYMFYSTTLSTNFSLPQGFGSAATNMSAMFVDVVFLSGFSFPAGFGSAATNMNAMFDSASFPSGFSLPQGFGSVATSMITMFQGVAFASDFSLPQGFGNVALDMSLIFADALLNGDIDWSGVDFTNKTGVEKYNMFIQTSWQGHFVLAKNQGSVDWLINGTEATAANVKVKGS